MQNAPETIASTREVVAVDFGGRRGIQAAEDDVEALGKDIRFTLGQRCRHPSPAFGNEPGDAGLHDGIVSRPGRDLIP